MKKLRFLPKEIAETRAKLEANPFKGEMASRPTESIIGAIARIYPSTSSNNEYCASIQYEKGEGWHGMCSCRGWAQCKRAEPARPCIHILDNLMEQVSFDLGMVMGEAAANETEEMIDLARKKAEAKAALAASAPGATVEEVKAAVATLSVPEDAMKLWSSRFPLLEACPASNVRPGECLIIQQDSQAASLGTVVHAAAERIVGEQLESPPDMSAMVEEIGLTEKAHLDDLPGLLWSVVREWNGSEYDKKEALKSYYASVYIEKRYEHRMEPVNPLTGEKQVVVTTARHDICGPSAVEGQWITVDWKTNRQENEPFYQAQMKMNAIALLANDQSINQVTTIIVWLRHGVRDVRTYNREQLRTWLLWMIKRRLFWDGSTYIEGSHCTYCPRVHTCEGRKQHMRNNINILSSVDTGLLLYDEDGNILEPDVLIERMEVCKAFRVIDKAFTKQLKELLSKSGTRPLAGQPGLGLGIKEKKGNIKIDVAEAWPILGAYLDPDQLTPALSLGKGNLEDAIKGAMRECEVCEGVGKVSALDGTEDGDGEVVIDCEACEGKGAVLVYPKGTGKIINELMDQLEDSGAATRGNPSKQVSIVPLAALDTE